MNIKHRCRLFAVITAIVMIFTVSAPFMGDESGVAYAASETKVNRVGTVTEGPLNVRSGPGTGYSVLDKLTKGDEITVLTQTKDSKGTLWYKFKYTSSKYGYVSAEYVKTETNVNKKGKVDTGNENLNVRRGPGTDFDKIGTISGGKEITVLTKIKNAKGEIWYKFKYTSSKEGFVSAEYIKFVPKNTDKVTEFQRKGIAKSNVTIRDGAGSVNTKLGVLKKDKPLYITHKVTKKSGAVWYKFKYDGKTAYVNSKYIKLTKIVSETKMNKKGTLTKKTNVRSGPDSTYSKRCELKKGTKITFVQKIKKSDGEIWYKYKYSDSKYGYIYKDNVTFVTGVTFKLGTVTTENGVTLNVRSGAGTEFKKLGSLSSGAIVTVLGSKKASNGKVWYKFKFSSEETGWICSDYVTVKTVTSTAEFETYMNNQGFPDSYKPGLRALKAVHPKWVFKAYDVGCSWDDAVAAEDKKPGLNVVDVSLPKSYRSKDSDCYNSKTGVWSRYDGRWYSAHTDVIKYYMDPRNFLTESEIYQFLTHKFDGNTQNAETVAAVVEGTFMETRNPGNGWKSFSTLINRAGEKSGVNPNVLAAMIIQEQGVKGTSGCISGEVKGYEGYYNFLNIGAWTTSTMSAVERGLWYAKKQGWDTEYKSIRGGADIYYENYVERNQYTFYTKKFNVMNGADKIGSHQYMTNVMGAQGEARQLKKAFPENYNKALTFIIPVYDDMPDSACMLP